jgi:hypothetical protein
MAWYLVKHNDNLTFTVLNITLPSMPRYPKLSFSVWF